MAYSMENRQSFFANDWPVIKMELSSARAITELGYKTLTDSEAKLFLMVTRFEQIIDDDQLVIAELMASADAIKQ